MIEKKECMDYIRSLKYGMYKEEVCRIRTEYCIEWYIRKAVKYKLIFISLSIVNIVIPQISAILVLETKCELASAIFSSIVSFSAALLALLNVKEKWTRYRAAAEHIKSEYTLYCIKASPYENDDAPAVYMRLLEQYMAVEQQDWIERQKETGTQKENK